MDNQLSFFNWSLVKLLQTEKDTFNRSKLMILYTVLVFSLIKIFIVLPVAWYYQQDFQCIRAIVVLAFYVTIFKFLLADKSYVKMVTHILIWGGILIVYSNILVIAKSVNIISLQFIYMIMVSGFYLLKRSWGIFYSCVSIIPVVVYMVYVGQEDILTIRPTSPESFKYPFNTIIIFLNFITIISCHYLYHKAFSDNIEEKEKLNIQLEEIAQEARLHAQSKSDFLSTMSHELRTPLNSVIGMTQLLLDDPHNEEQQENLGILNFSAISLHALINDILDFNKLDSDKLTLETINVDLENLMRSICSGLEIQSKEKGLNLILDIDPALHKQVVITDPTRLTQIIYNLTGNGIKFTSKGYVKVSLKMLHRTEQNTTIRFEVADTGIGIEQDKHFSIFEPFVQASTNTTRNYGGTGLGLPIVKKLLALFNSSIHLNSEPGVGSAFSFDLVFTNSNEPVTNIVDGTEPDYDLTGLRVLVAEDNPINVFLIKKLCVKWHITPIIVENGFGIVDEVKANMYDVILMDIHMPEMDGYEAARRIRIMSDPVKANIPIIALTASVSHDLNKKIKQWGINDYLRKPFNAKELYGKLKVIALSRKVNT